MEFTEAVRILREHEADLKKMGVISLYMFGSTVHGDQRPDSDVDLFFDYDGSLSLFDVMHIKEKASEILGCEAHIMTRGSINKHYRPHIEPNAVPVF